jgi:hypothetical protein
MTRIEKKLASLRQKVWNGTPIRYQVEDIGQLDSEFTTYILCMDYAHSRDNFPRYAAVKAGHVVAVAIDDGFANLVVDPLFTGNLMLLAPYYDVVDGKLEYIVPVVEEN